jgi:hypothetical protein
LSALAWITFIICAVAVSIRYIAAPDSVFLFVAIPGLILLLVIPMTLSWMSRRSYAQATYKHSKKGKDLKIAKISLEMIGNIVRLSGIVQKISFKWLNRPHFQIKDETGVIRVIMFASPAEEIRVGDNVGVFGIVMKNIFALRTPAISAVSVKKKDD